MFMKETADRLFGDDYRWSVLAAGRFQMPFATHAATIGGQRKSWTGRLAFHQPRSACSFERATSDENPALSGGARSYDRDPRRSQRHSCAQGRRSSRILKDDKRTCGYAVPTQDDNNSTGEANEYRHYRSSALGSNAARLLVKSGVSATIANSGGPQSLSRLVGELGPSVKAGSVEEAATADMVLVAVRWVDLEKALGGLPAWNDRIVIDGTNPVAYLDPDSPDAKDPTNPLAAYGIKAIDLGGKHSAKYSARSFRAHAWSRHSTTSTPTSCPSRRRRVVKGSCSIRATTPMRRPRSANFSNALAISRSTLVSSTSADRLRHLRSARLPPLTSSSSDRRGTLRCWTRRSRRVAERLFARATGSVPAATRA
jgi:F420-dependent NADP oxidoreductase-like protein